MSVGGLGFLLLLLLVEREEAFVILLAVLAGPKARVCWARGVGLEGLRRVGGIVWVFLVGGMGAGWGRVGFVLVVEAVVCVWEMGSVMTFC